MRMSSVSVPYALGGTLAEQQRLIAQARGLEPHARWMLDRIAIKPGSRAIYRRLPRKLSSRRCSPCSSRAEPSPFRSSIRRHYVCYPEHPSWVVLLGLWNDTFNATGGNEWVGRSLAGLLRSAGAENVQMKAHVEVAEVGREYRRTHLLSLIESMREGVLDFRATDRRRAAGPHGRLVGASRGPPRRPSSTSCWSRLGDRDQIDSIECQGTAFKCNWLRLLRSRLAGRFSQVESGSDSVGACWAAIGAMPTRFTPV